jgi:hypothetical protein
MTKKEKLKEIELAKQREIDLVNEFNQMVEQTEAEKTNLKTQINQIVGDKYFCGVMITKEIALQILDNFMSGVTRVKMDLEIYEIENNSEI